MRGVNGEAVTGRMAPISLELLEFIASCRSIWYSRCILLSSAVSLGLHSPSGLTMDQPETKHLEAEPARQTDALTPTAVYQKDAPPILHLAPRMPCNDADAREVHHDARPPLTAKL